MNMFSSLLIFVLSLCCIPPLAGQEIHAQEKQAAAPSQSKIIGAFWAPSKNPMPAFVPNLAWNLRRFVNTIDLQIRKWKSFRMFSFPVMDLWVDEYDQLINERDNVIGKWGIDVPAIPMHSIPQIRR